MYDLLGAELITYANESNDGLERREPDAILRIIKHLQQSFEDFVGIELIEILRLEEADDQDV